MKPWQSFIKMPNQWIEDNGLCRFKWIKGSGANHLAALITFAPILHHMDKVTGTTRLTYTQLTNITNLSREKVARGLDVLLEFDLITYDQDKRSVFHVADYDPNGGWVKFPAKALYRGEDIYAFGDFNLRKRAELDAMKLYYLFASRRDRKTNMAKIGFGKIEIMTGIPRNNIKGGLNILAANGLIHVERIPSSMSDYGVANAYRLAHLDSYIHMGTRGRGMDSNDFMNS